MMVQVQKRDIDLPLVLNNSKFVFVRLQSLKIFQLTSRMQIPFP